EGTSITLPGKKVMVGVYDTMKQKFRGKLEQFYEFNDVSSSNFVTAHQVAKNMDQGFAEVQSGKGFSPVCGTLSILDLNM
ncbi:hypothetical protein FO601_37385, partial [Bacillus thuringiensis]|nr:hypothetical protein [Bacillus thuringiensis]